MCSRLQLLVREGILGEKGRVAHGVKKMGAGEGVVRERHRDRDREREREKYEERGRETRQQ